VSATPRDEPAEAEPAEADAEEYIDGQEEDSFPASDPHSDWAGPPEGDPPERD
jgi:hypothetical protein